MLSMNQSCFIGPLWEAEFHRPRVARAGEGGLYLCKFCSDSFPWAVSYSGCWCLRQCLDTNEGLGSLRLNAPFTVSFIGANAEQKLAKRLICVSDFFNQFVLNQNRVHILFKNLVLTEISIADLGSLNFYFDRSPEKPILLQSLSDSCRSRKLLPY